MKFDKTIFPFALDGYEFVYILTNLTLHVCAPLANFQLTSNVHSIGLQYQLTKIPWQNVMNAPWLQTLINTANTNTKN